MSNDKNPAPRRTVLQPTLRFLTAVTNSERPRQENVWRHILGTQDTFELLHRKALFIRSIDRANQYLSKFGENHLREYLPSLNIFRDKITTDPYWPNKEDEYRRATVILEHAKYLDTLMQIQNYSETSATNEELGALHESITAFLQTIDKLSLPQDLHALLHRWIRDLKATLKDYELFGYETLQDAMPGFLGAIGIINTVAASETDITVSTVLHEETKKLTTKVGQFVNTATTRAPQVYALYRLGEATVKLLFP